MTDHPQDEARAAKVAQLHATVEIEVPVQDGSEYIEKFAQPVPPECVGILAAARCFGGADVLSVDDAAAECVFTGWTVTQPH